MNRLLAFGYGLVCYVCFFGTFLYAIGFLANLWVPKTIDSGTAGPIGRAIVINGLLLLLFAVQHTPMARPGFKKWWTKFVPAPIERSTYVLLSSLVLILLFWQWRPMPTVVWQVDNAIGSNVLMGLFFAGPLLVVVSSFLIDHFDLFGMRQVYLYLRGVEYTHHPFSVPFLYKFVRHPLYVGWFLTFWCAPTMSQGHLLFAVVSCAYILVAIVFEERDLLHFLGEDYAQYRRKVPMLIPWPRKRTARATASDA